MTTASPTSHRSPLRLTSIALALLGFLVSGHASAASPGLLARSGARMASVGRTVRTLHGINVKEAVRKGHALGPANALVIAGSAGMILGVTAVSAQSQPALAAMAAIGLASTAGPAVSRSGWHGGDMAQPKKFGAPARAFTRVGASLGTAIDLVGYGVLKTALPFMSKRIRETLPAKLTLSDVVEARKQIADQVK